MLLEKAQLLNWVHKRNPCHAVALCVGFLGLLGCLVGFFEPTLSK